MTGIAISALKGRFSDNMETLFEVQIAAAAVINEIIAVFLARKGFKGGRRDGKGYQMQIKMI